MRKISAFILLTVLCGCLLSGCHTTQENYRRAYERTMQRDSTRADFNETVYARYRNAVRPGHIVADSDTIATQIVRITVTPNTGGLSEYIRPYCIVAAEFKQLFNATSMQERLRDAGWPRTFIAQTPEPYYYVIAATAETPAQAAATLDSLRANTPVRLRKPCPFILQPTQLLK